MIRHVAIFGELVAGLIFSGAAYAAENAGALSLAPSLDVGWIAYGNTFMPIPGRPGPVQNDPARPYKAGIVPDPYVAETPEFLAARLAKEPATGTNRLIADLTNPILQPWAREEVAKWKEVVLSGRPAYGRQVSCWPVGVPGFLQYPVQPVFIIAGEREVAMVWQTDHQIRRIYLNREHDPNAKPSWFGDSVGHYEGDTLVVDTINVSTKTFVDNYRTPHTEKLHVVERFRVIDNGQTLEARLFVEDEGAFTIPWEAMQLYRRVEPGPLIEASCAENNVNYFKQEVDPIPMAAKADF